MLLPFLIFLASSLATTGQVAGVEIINPALSQGETLIISFKIQPEQITFADKEIKVFAYQNSWRAIIPVALATKAGTQSLKIKFPTGAMSYKISLLEKERRIINLPVPPKLKQTPRELVQNLAKTNAAIRETVKVINELTLFSEPFGLPLADNTKISSPFGEIRKTGEEEITHLGTDFDSPKGAPVYAMNDGMVSQSYLDSIYGNSIIIDHGQGIYSLYLHLDSLMVKAGDNVRKGEQIGAVGETGLASAPHLHLSIKISGVSVDPIQFVNNFK